MDGEFTIEHDTGLMEGTIGGGNILILGRSHAEVLAAAEAAVEAASVVPGVILPFPGRHGAVRLQGRLQVQDADRLHQRSLQPGSARRLEFAVGRRYRAVLELVMDGLTFEAVQESMRRALHAACAFGPEKGIQRITAGNYGGNLGRHHFHLKDLL